jgi:hypothetical protein
MCPDASDDKCRPTAARVKLRAAVANKKLKHDHGQAWEWPKGSAAIKDVRATL